MSPPLDTKKSVPASMQGEPGEREKQIDTAKKLGTRTFVEVAGYADNVPRAVELAESRDDFYFGVACHPNRVEMYSGEKDLALFRKTFKEHPKKWCASVSAAWTMARRTTREPKSNAIFSAT